MAEGVANVVFSIIVRFLFSQLSVFFLFLLANGDRRTRERESNSYSHVLLVITNQLVNPSKLWKRSTVVNFKTTTTNKQKTYTIIYTKILFSENIDISKIKPLSASVLSQPASHLNKTTR